jgi:hypothetical protein
MMVMVRQQKKEEKRTKITYRLAALVETQAIFSTRTTQFAVLAVVDFHTPTIPAPIAELGRAGDAHTAKLGVIQLLTHFVSTLGGGLHNTAHFSNRKKKEEKRTPRTPWAQRRACIAWSQTSKQTAHRDII